jgi:beta-lactamase superfamily II metal-dependent hydrolase
VELYQTTHLGQAQSGAPLLIHAMAPLVAVLNYGASKGGAATRMRNRARSPGFQDLWQVHRSNSAGADNTAVERIANSAGADRGSGNDENAASVGQVASWGNFQMVNLGDLLSPLEHDLACPVNKLGQVELYQTTHHGQAQSGAPQLIHAMAPLVAVMNNGASKGGAATSMRNLARSPGFQDLWQVHRSNSAGADNTADERIANSAGADQGRWLKASVRADGSFTLLNPRNMHTKTYQSR